MSQTAKPPATPAQVEQAAKHLAPHLRDWHSNGRMSVTRAEIQDLFRGTKFSHLSPGTVASFLEGMGLLKPAERAPTIIRPTLLSLQAGSALSKRP